MLSHNKLVVTLSTMASFQKTGERYDTSGINPHIAMEPVPTDSFGATGSVLERVRAMVAEGRTTEKSHPRSRG